jgi:hypothetical protein
MHLAAPAEVPLREHPRPDFERPAWVNLNGPWSFDFDKTDAGEKEQWFLPGKHEFARRIVVPFPWESRLSEIADTEYRGVAWYSRQVKLPSGGEWKGRDPWLVVGACDFEAKVWVNGQPACEHVGGYVPFEINLGKFAKPGSTITITIRAVDFSKDEQPTGKQVNWYTRNSGIWQTVYLEPRAKTYITQFRATPDVPNGTMDYAVSLNHAQRLTVRLSSLDGAFPAAEQTIKDATTPVQLKAKLNKPQLWSPDSPTLYPVVVEVLENGKVVDKVNSYFGLREVSIKPADGRDYQYICLNGKPVYLRGALHQSFHPAGIYQYPSDAVVRSDYELCKQIGINFLRVHIKIPTPRELYWADKLGVLMMQDMPCYWNHTPQAQAWWEQMLRASIDRDFNHPSIFAWIDFNETWGIGHQGYKPDRHAWVEQMYKLTRQLDPTRLVEDNSPCNYDHVATDINSWHFYINDYAAARKHIAEVVDKTFPGSGFNYVEGRKQDNDPLMNSEYGGIGAGSGDQDVSWCFKFLTNELRLHDKICGYIYTELSDIEWEHNGFANYDRTPKYFGYDFWHPDMTLADLNGADFVGIDAPPMIELKPDEQRDVPIKVSHWSERTASSLAIRYRMDWFDGFGNRSEGIWQTQPAKWEPFKVVDQATIHIDAGKVEAGRVGALLVQLVDGPTVIARNYVNLLIDRGPQPRVESVDGKTVALRFSPMDFAEWTFRPDAANHQSLAADKVSGTGTGQAEYRLRLPEKVNLDRLSEITILAELASKAGSQKLDWPARTTAGDYPQTDVRTWPTDVTIFVNDQKVATVALPDDPADTNGALSHYRGYEGSHGYLVRESLKGAALDALRAAAQRDRVLRVRFEVPATADHKGGLAVFGQNIGCYPLDPTILLTFDGDHGLGADFKSDQPVATDIARCIVLPSAESGRHNWRYTFDKPADDWTSPKFDDAQWATGPSGFGSRGTPNVAIGTKWNKADIWLRTTATIDSPADIASAHWRLYHDEDAEIYVNGTKVLDLKGFEPQYVDVPLDKKAIDAFRPGENTIAAHCHNTAGGQAIDVGLMTVKGK